MIDSVQMPVMIAIDEESTALLRDLEHAKTLFGNDDQCVSDRQSL
jgi:hypothetical protein